MRKLIGARALAVLLASGSLATQALAGPFYSYTTEDGVFAYTDDAKAVPKRYARQVREIAPKRLSSYERFTVQDGTAADRYAERLAARLDHLRQANAQSPTHGVARGGSTGFPPMISVSTGTGANSPRVHFPTGGSAGAEPLVLEPILTKRSGDVRTRRTTLVRQGDRIVAVLMGPRHVRNPSTDIHDEDALVSGR